MASRDIPRISLRDFDKRKDEIRRQLIDAAENVGFFIIKDQEYPNIADIEEVFSISERFFKLPDAVKNKTPHLARENTGWEKNAQVRPSTNTPDQKESLQLQYYRRHDQTWPKISEIPEFYDVVSSFMEKTQTVSMQILSCFAIAMGFEEDFFTKRHDVTKVDAQTTLRLLHYHDTQANPIPDGHVRAGAHTDFDCMTLLFQRTGEDGLEVCPGRACHTSFGYGDVWTPVEAMTGEIVCNIGDMLMMWSGERFKSLFHRVRPPAVGEPTKARHSIAYFNQANKTEILSDPRGGVEPMTAHRFILNAIARNYGHLEKVKAEKAEKAEREAQNKLKSYTESNYWTE